MHEAALVRVRERIRDRGANAGQLGDRERTAFDERLERATPHELHDEELHAVVDVEVVDRRHARMREA